MAQPRWAAARSVPELVGRRAEFAALEDELIAPRRAASGLCSWSARPASARAASGASCWRAARGDRPAVRCSPRSSRALASGAADAVSGRGVHASGAERAVGRREDQVRLASGAARRGSVGRRHGHPLDGPAPPGCSRGCPGEARVFPVGGLDQARPGSPAVALPPGVKVPAPNGWLAAAVGAAVWWRAPAAAATMWSPSPAGSRRRPSGRRTRLSSCRCAVRMEPRERRSSFVPTAPATWGCSSESRPAPTTAGSRWRRALSRLRVLVARAAREPGWGSSTPSAVYSIFAQRRYLETAQGHVPRRLAGLVGVLNGLIDRYS